MHGDSFCWDIENSVGRDMHLLEGRKAPNYVLNVTHILTSWFSPEFWYMCAVLGLALRLRLIYLMLWIHAHFNSILPSEAVRQSLDLVSVVPLVLTSA